MHLPGRMNRAATAFRPERVRMVVAALASGVAVVALTGCAGFEYQSARERRGLRAPEHPDLPG